MDGITERKIVSLVLEEAARLKQQADSEGVSAYLNPKVRCRPNSRFLQTQVIGVERANRAAQMREMWESRTNQEHSEGSPAMKRAKPSSAEKKIENRLPAKIQDPESELNYEDDFQVDNFLRSRKKRGRGSVGARMDMVGPYREDEFLEERIREKWEKVVMGPTRDSFPNLPSSAGDKWERGLDVEKASAPELPLEPSFSLAKLSDEAKAKRKQEKKERAEKRSKRKEKGKSGERKKKKEKEKRRSDKRRSRDGKKDKKQKEGRKKQSRAED